MFAGQGTQFRSGDRALLLKGDNDFSGADIYLDGANSNCTNYVATAAGDSRPPATLRARRMTNKGANPSGIGENVSALRETDVADYTQFLVRLAKPLAESAKRPKVVMRSPFWRNSAKADCTAQAAKEVGAIYVDAGSLGDKDENMALGLFGHKGVARHPGDIGMRRLADLVLSGFEGAARPVR